MRRGISTNVTVDNIINCLRENNNKFVCRYYSRTTSQPQKRLVSNEAVALTEAGIDIVAIYEDGPEKASYFSRDRGIQDGKSACAYAAQIGQPAGSAIYFAVDYDALAPDVIGRIQQYFEGVKQGMAQPAGAAQYDIGVYGSGLVCSHIKEEKHLAKYSWLAASHRWGEYGAYTNPDIRQQLAVDTFCGLKPGPDGDYEDNFAEGDIGAFSSVGAAREMPAAALPMVTKPAGVPSEFSRRLVATALQQYEQYHRYTENEVILQKQIRAYWEDLGYEFPGLDTAWSAVFISWLMRKSGASAEEFKVAKMHSRFVFWAIQNARNGTGYFHANRLEDYAPKVGDLIQNNRGGNDFDYDYAAKNASYSSHSAVVVALGADDKGRHAITIGGNESDSLRRARVALNHIGKVVQRTVDPYVCVIQNLK